MRHLVIGVLFSLCFAANSLGAAANGLFLRDFDHTAWSLRDGAPSQIFALAQTRDGFLWLGTANGLFRFDGVKFELVQPAGGQSPSQVSVQSLLATPDGGLWIGYTLGGTSFLKAGDFEDHKLRVNGRFGTVWYLAADPDGSIWAATTVGLAHFFAGSWHGVSKEAGFAEPSAYRVFFDREKTLWIVTDHLLYRKKRGTDTFERTPLEAGSNAAFDEAADGTLYVTDTHGALALDQLRQPEHTRRYAILDNELVEVRLDDQGSLWALSSSYGVKRASDPDPRSGPPTVEQAVNLTSERTSASLKDREGTIWIATSGGLDRYRRFALRPAPLPDTFGFYALATDTDGSILVGSESDGLNRLEHGALSRVPGIPFDRITCLLRGPDGKLWIGGAAALGYLENHRYVALSLPVEIASSTGDTQTMAISRDGSLWVQPVNNRPLVRWTRGVWSTLEELPSHPGSAVTLAQDHSGRMWSGYMDGHIAIYDGTKPIELSTREWSGLGNVTALYSSGTDMWIGGTTGLGIYRDGQARVVRFAGDIPIRGVSGITRLDDGSLWLNALPGIIRIAADEVTHLLRDPDYSVQYRLFDNLDGLKGKAPQLRPLPSVVQGADGLLWFATTNGVVSIDPNNIPRNTVVPPVAITSILSDGRPLAFRSSADLPAGSQGLELHYAALSLAIPERVRFRYQLTGFDTDWQDAGARRQAFYPHLPPGRYVFKVVAANNDGVWNKVGASVPIRLAPTFVQSVYFKLLLGAAALALLWLIYAWRLRQVTQGVNERLFERFAERERIARDLHDTFFQGIQGLLLSIQSASRRLPPADPVRAQLESTLAQSDQVMLEGRQLVLDLRTQSTEAHELGKALEAAARQNPQGSATAFELSVIGEPVPLNALVSEELYTLGREAINNAFRHASATVVEAEIDYQKAELRLCIRDNGVGIPATVLEHGGIPHHFGLPGMKERARKIGATVQFRNQARGGAEVIVKIAARLAYRTRRRKL